jgi:alpha-mannosidase
MCALVLTVDPVFAEPAGQSSGSEKRATFWLIPHTHWEGAVFKTRQEYLDMGLDHILTALKLLDSHPSYRFVLDQVCYVKPFLERYPEQEDAFRRFIAEGRLEIVGGTDVMLDVNMPSGESFVRQVLYGKGYFRQKLGVDVKVGWQLDTFGHHAQMPQLLGLAGIKSFWFFRGVPSLDVPAEFLWEGLDGSRIPAFWQPRGYTYVYRSPNKLPKFRSFVQERFDTLTGYARQRDCVGMVGGDVSPPEEHLPELVERFNRQPDAPFTIRLAVPSEFESEVAKRTDRTVVRGELNPIFQGGYSSRIELKQWTRNLERLLVTAEKLGVLVNWLGGSTDERMLWRAWEPMLFNQAHDLMAGVMTDRVYEDTMGGYRFSKRLADQLVETRLDSFLSRVDTQGDGIALAVFNSLSWQRTDIVEFAVGFSASGVRGFRASNKTSPLTKGGMRGVEKHFIINPPEVLPCQGGTKNEVLLDALSLLDPAGKEVPVQILSAKRDRDGGLIWAKIAFVAREVPGLGYCVYKIMPLRCAGESQSGPYKKAAGSLENEYFRVGLDLSTGAMTELVLKSNHWNALTGAGNVVSCEEDRGDLWELYEKLKSWSRVAMKRRQAVPGPGQARFSNQYKSNPGSLLDGPVVGEYKVSHPFGKKGSFATTVRLYAGVPRVEVRTKILNNQKFVRYQVLFPTSIEKGRSVHEIPFGAIERPSAIEFPAQNWVDYSDGTRGLALLNRGLPGNIVTDGTMMLSLMRSTCIVAYYYSGGYERGASSASGFELGKQLTFDYALVPHQGNWPGAGIYRAGLEFNNPLMARKVAPHEGALPKRWGFLQVSHPNVVMSSLKPGAGGSIILRVYEAAGEVSPGVKIKLHAKVISAEAVNLMEDPGPSLEVNDDTLVFDLAAFQIKTFKLLLKGKGQ